MTDAERSLDWAHGSLTVQRLGAMMAPVHFRLADGKTASPLHVAAWADMPATPELPGILRRLRGEWPCVPFGYSVPSDGWPREWADVMWSPAGDEEVHGHSSNHDWDWQDADDASLRLALDYPANSPVARVERVVTPDPSAPAVDLIFRVFVRRKCSLPIGLHPVFRLPTQPGSARLELGAFRIGRTYPETVEPGKAIFRANAAFQDITAVPARNSGAAIDASALPFIADAEELLQIEGLDGQVALANFADGYRARLSWNPNDFPSLLLWMSNRGRTAEPWNGDHLAIGIEPVCSPYGLGPATALADNPIALSGVPTALEFSPESPFETHYRISVESL
ncbi:hypothetical protein C6558_13475 [Ensifer sp. NM-2]|uniref:hypothetical protein n=1 Tax=Ensifer sp. NM-2 TaxID=2109730 RepID=UPI000D1162D4|nr:hypothetical protein [Ensifer sp. NM-2]PSS64486.1 hypothetical protein C6558_13475 [Ensifer sp. NM-2]